MMQEVQPFKHTQVCVRMSQKIYHSKWRITNGKVDLTIATRRIAMPSEFETCNLQHRPRRGAGNE